MSKNFAIKKGHFATGLADAEMRAEQCRLVPSVCPGDEEMERGED